MVLVLIQTYYLIATAATLTGQNKSISLSLFSLPLCHPPSLAPSIPPSLTASLPSRPFPPPSLSLSYILLCNCFFPPSIYHSLANQFTLCATK